MSCTPKLGVRWRRAVSLLVPSRLKGMAEGCQKALLRGLPSDAGAATRGAQGAVPKGPGRVEPVAYRVTLVTWLAGGKTSAGWGPYCGKSRVITTPSACPTTVSR